MERFPFAINEWYHCYSRGIDKCPTFLDKNDYERFLALLYVCNSDTTIHRSDLLKHSLSEILQTKRGEPLVVIGAFCSMPNHFHLLIKEIRERGTSTFMQKLGTAYTMYFNIKYERSGGLFTKPFRSRHVNDNRYLQKVIGYIHCNPADIFEPEWKNGTVTNLETLQKNLENYQYSSLSAFLDANQPTRKILSEEIFTIETQPLFQNILQDAFLYHQDQQANVKASP